MEATTINTLEYLFQGQARLREYDSRYRNEILQQNPKLLNDLLLDIGLSFNVKVYIQNRTTAMSLDFIKSVLRKMQCIPQFGLRLQ